MDTQFESLEQHQQLIIQIEIEKNESASRRRQIEHYIAMLEAVKAKVDAVLAHNAIDAMKGSDRFPGGYPRLRWFNPPVQRPVTWGALHPNSEM